MPFLARRSARGLVCPLALAVVLTGAAGSQTFKLACWNIKSGKGQIVGSGIVALGLGEAWLCGGRSVCVPRSLGDPPSPSATAF